MANIKRSDIQETEEELIARAQFAVSQCNWSVGECASKWTVKYAKNRTDGDFGQMVGLTADQVYQRRRVWETFCDVYENYADLKWSHFYVALNWDDAPECFQWAQENQTTVAEMKAWRRASRGEDLDQESEIDEWGSANYFLPTSTTEVRDPDEFAQGREPVEAGMVREPSSGKKENPAVVGTVARDSDNYSPFRSGAASVPPKESSEPVAQKALPPVDVIAKKMCSTLERFNKMLAPEVMDQFESLPDKLKARLVEASGEFSSKIARLM